MIFAGLQKTSLIDYRGKVSCVAFVTGCNLACPYCHNPDLARGRYPERISLDALLRFLDERKGLLDGVVISGGEPTLASGLADACRAIHALGLAVKLDTNGSRPDVLGHLLGNGLIDYVAMDVKTPPDRYAPVLADEDIARQVRRSIGLILSGGVDYEFRTTCVRPFVDDALIVEIAQAIEGARRYALQSFRPDVVLRPSFFPDTAAGFSPQEMTQLRRAAAPYVTECILLGE